MKGFCVMPNFVKVLKEEIARIGRKESRIALRIVRVSAIRLKKDVAKLKKQVSKLEKENRFLLSLEKKRPLQQSVAGAVGGRKPRITAKGIRSLRRKLRLSQVEFAKLLGTTSQTVYLWERKNGALKLRGNMASSILSIRGLGAREAKRKTAEIQPKASRKRVSKRKKSKRR
jgi:DNA-binding transcriptional regulator YiaG